MTEYRTERGVFFQGDCMEGMATFPDKYFDIAIVDPPYGIGQSGGAYANSARGSARGFSGAVIHKRKEWDKATPDQSYFDELFRISKNQIIWGGNHFTDKIPVSRGWAIWYKNVSQNSRMHSDCELAWTSFDMRARLFVHDYIGIGYINGKAIHGEKIHPTQKPVQLYRWLISQYCPDALKIFDSHVGSASSLIAYEDAGLEYVGYELDADYYKAAVQRIKDHKSQLTMFPAGIE